MSPPGGAQVCRREGRRFKKEQLGPVHRRYKKVCEAKVVRVSKESEEAKKKKSRVHTRDTLPILQIHVSLATKEITRCIPTIINTSTTPIQVVQISFCVPTMHVSVHREEENANPALEGHASCASSVYRLKSSLRHPIGR